MNTSEDFPDRGALLGELAIDRRITAFDPLAHS